MVSYFLFQSEFFPFFFLFCFVWHFFSEIISDHQICNPLHSNWCWSFFVLAICTHFSIACHWNKRSSQILPDRTVNALEIHFNSRSSDTFISFLFSLNIFYFEFSCNRSLEFSRYIYISSDWTHWYIGFSDYF